MAASRFLATTLCRWTEPSVTVLGALVGGRRKCPQTTIAARPHVFLLVDSSAIGYLSAFGRNVSLLSKMAKFFPVRVRFELIRDVWNMINCFLQHNDVEGTAHCCDQLCGLATGGASVPLKE